MRLPGALYAVALPTGEWACLYPGSHIQSVPWGRIKLPGFDILEFRMTLAEGGKIAGKAQREPGSPDVGTWLWRATTSKWEHVNASAHGTYPCIFTKDGTLVQADPAQHGSQGFRYVAEDGRLVSGDDTLNDQRRVGLELGLDEMWEYTYLGGVVIGQGAEWRDGHENAGCRVVIDGQRRSLEDGDTHFINVEHADGWWAVAMTKLAQGESVIYWLTRPELSMLPPVTQSPAPIPPPPVTPPEPTPVSEAFPHSALMQQFVAKFPLPQTPGGGEAHEDKCREWCLHLAQQVRFSSGDESWGVKRAAGPQSKDTIARKISNSQLVVFDLMASAGSGFPTLNTQPHGEVVTGQTFIPVIPVNHLGSPAPAPQPPTQPPTQPVPDTELAKRVASLEKRLERLENAGLLLGVTFKP